MFPLFDGEFSFRFFVRFVRFGGSNAARSISCNLHIAVSILIDSNSRSIDRIIQDDSKVGKILHSVVFLYYKFGDSILFRCRISWGHKRSVF